MQQSISEHAGDTATKRISNVRSIPVADSSAATSAAPTRPGMIMLVVMGRSSGSPSGPPTANAASKELYDRRTSSSDFTCGAPSIALMRTPSARS
jgi:hypothetical protein